MTVWHTDNYCILVSNSAGGKTGDSDDEDMESSIAYTGTSGVSTMQTMVGPSSMDKTTDQSGHPNETMSTLQVPERADV